MKMIVSDASPLIILAKANLLELLRLQFANVLVPQAVINEILAGPMDDPMRNLLTKLEWMKPVHVELSPLAIWRLGQGETEVIEYARLHPGSIALLDDRSARKIALAVGVKTYGTLSVVARQAARDRSLSFGHLTDRLKHAGLYLDDQVVLSVKKSLQHG